MFGLVGELGLEVLVLQEEVVVGLGKGLELVDPDFGHGLLLAHAVGALLQRLDHKQGGRRDEDEHDDDQDDNENVLVADEVAHEGRSLEHLLLGLLLQQGEALGDVVADPVLVHLVV